MALKPEVSMMVGLATATLVYGVYSNATPTLAEIRATPKENPQLDSSRKTAAWTSAAVVAGVSLIARDATVFILGGGMVVALDWWHRHGNMVNPTNNRATAPMMDQLPIETQSSGGDYGYADSVE